MMRISGAIVAIFMLMAASAAGAADATFVEGKQYRALSPTVPVSTPPGIVEVVEVFSYGCPACNAALPMTQKLKESLPRTAQLVLIPAAFNPSEAWPMFQRAFITAQVMGIAEKNHLAMFNAIWVTGDLPLVDPVTKNLRPKLPTIEDAARFYAKQSGIKEADFVATSKSFAVETRIGRAEQLVRAYQADSTPTFVVNGKYVVEPSRAGSYDAAAAVIRFLVAKESGH
jgi:protein dithiol oxidoreductase (disulfide-forming)